MLHKLTGVVSVYKPPGMTSHDVVYRIRRVFGQKAGHTGTLDPGAEGVLPVCVGSATKLSMLVTDSDKEYRVEVIFGTETDTQDSAGNVLRAATLETSEAEFVDAVNSFRGAYEQIPPMYSAIKIKGKKLYELARAGITAEREPRTIQIIDIQINLLDLPNRAVLTVRCSKGAYMRTLCEDLGRRLGSCAHMGRLIRTEAAGISLKDTVSLELIQNSGNPEGFILPITEIPALRGLRHIGIPTHLDKRLKSGGVFGVDELHPAAVTPSEKVMVFTSDNILAGIYIAALNKLKPYIMLH